MATQTHARLKSEELATSLWEAGVKVLQDRLDQEEIAHLLFRAHKMIAEQNRALRRGSELLSATKELNRLLKK